MPPIYVSSEAEADIDSIAEYTKTTWGQRQAAVYLAKLEYSFELLARNPMLGRSCDAILPGLRRYEVEKHVVFYTLTLEGILISRVLHHRMLPKKSRFEV
jgi:toxin ParE1/3/4